jgi:hypothetical protein
MSKKSERLNDEARCCDRQEHVKEFEKEVYPD